MLTKSIITKQKNVKCLGNFRKKLFLNIAILKNKILNTNTITKMKEFNSQVCTTKEQSQRLLELGLKPETADMVLIKELAYDEVAHCTYDADTYMIRPIDYLEGERHRGHIPAWSLHRLYEMYLSFFGNASLIFRSSQNPYDVLISDIEQMINADFFNKEYLKQ